MTTILISVNVFDVKNKCFQVEEVNPKQNTLNQIIRTSLKTRMILEIHNSMRLTNTDKFTLLSHNKIGGITKYLVRKVGSFSYLIVSNEDEKITGYYNIKIIEDPVVIPKELMRFVEEFANGNEEQELFNYNKKPYRMYRKDSEIFIEHIYSGISGKVVLVHM